MVDKSFGTLEVCPEALGGNDPGTQEDFYQGARTNSQGVSGFTAGAAKSHVVRESFLWSG